MRITGQYDDSGQFMPFSEGWEVSQIGDQLRLKADGFLAAVKHNGEWVSPVMLNLGSVNKLKVVD